MPYSVLVDYISSNRIVKLEGVAKPEVERLGEEAVRMVKPRRAITSSSLTLRVSLRTAGLRVQPSIEVTVETDMSEIADTIKNKLAHYEK